MTQAIETKGNIKKTADDRKASIVRIGRTRIFVSPKKKNKGNIRHSNMKGMKKVGSPRGERRI